MSNFVNRLLTLLEQTITGLGGVVPAAPAPFNRDERSVQLLDLLRQRLGTGLIVVPYSVYVPSLSTLEYIFVADRSFNVVGIQYLHTVAEVTAVSMNIYLRRVLPGALPTGGNSINLTEFNGKGAAGVLQASTTFFPSGVPLNAGDRLYLFFPSAPTELRGVHVTVYLTPV